MKEAKVFTRLILCLSILGINYMQYTNAACLGLRSWSGSITSADNAVNEDVTLDSNPITINNDGVHVYASTCDISVTMGSDVVINGNGNARLYLEVANGHSITFHIDNNLSFEGPLLVIARGSGSVIFNVRGGKSFALSPNGTSGTKFFVCMQEDLQVCFNRETGVATNQDAHIIVGSYCLLTYLAEDSPETSTEVGCIKWNPSNTDTGRMVLTVANRGAVVIRGCKTADCSLSEITLIDIDCSAIAGHDAVMKIENNVGDIAHAGLLVLNQNAVWPELLVDPFCNLETREDINEYKGLFTGVQYGFILGANATFTVLENAYLDYVGLTGTVCLDIPNVDNDKLKARTPSAFIIDGSNDPFSTPAKISLANQAAIYLRSGVDRFGTIRPLSDPHPFTIDPLYRVPGAGYTVMHIEGQLDVCGANLSAVSPAGLQSMIEVLSLEVGYTGGPLFVGTNETIFPLRTFAADGLNQYYQYNPANIMINNCWNMFSAALKHTDEAHTVLEKNDATSEPTYIGGDTAALKNQLYKPRLSLHSSVLLVHTNIALTGFDLFVPNGLDYTSGDCVNNTSRFYFFQNGRVIDNGTGRQMILGTYIGSTACDGCSVIYRDVCLDVSQATACVGGASLTQVLELKVQANNDTINENISGDISTQTSIHTLYLGGDSNISIGTNGTTGVDKQGNSFALTTLPQYVVCGNYFSFETRGGSVGLPSSSSVTGQGGIFVDRNGTFSLATGFLAYFGTMITKSANAVVNVPKRCSLFDSCVGVSDWNLDLSIKQDIVPLGITVSDYTVNWMFIKKDYAGGFAPYENASCLTEHCSGATANNIYHLPTIKGYIDQLQIKGSRLGDRAHVLIDGGTVREFVPCVGFNSLGSANRNSDSLRANTRLGSNGITIIANGNCTIALNDDVLVDNNCSLVAGPNFDPAIHTVAISSEEEHSFIVTAGTTFDLSGLHVVFTGNIDYIKEPGSRIIFGEANRNISTATSILGFKDNARLILLPVPYVLDSAIDLPESILDSITSCLDTPLPSFAQNNNDRVSFIGCGKVLFENNASMSIPRGSALSIETSDDLDIVVTSIEMELKDSARVSIGDERANGFGGCVQVGNLIDHLDASITFSLVLNGSDTSFIVGAQGFLGLAVGCVCKSFRAPNHWRVKPLCNVENINLTLVDGTFKHSHIWSGDDEYASLVAISAGQDTNVNYSVAVSPLAVGDGLSRTSILGGGNIVSIDSNAGTINPVVTDDDGDMGSYSASVLASRVNIANSISGNNVDNVFNFLKLKDLLSAQPVTGRGVASRNQKNHKVLNAAWIFNNKIGRESFDNLVCTGGKLIAHQHIAQSGSISLSVDLTSAPGSIRNVVEIP